MALIATLEIDDYEIKDGYMRPRNAFRSSDAHFGAPSGSSDSTRSGKPGSVPGDVFTALNLDTVFMNQPSSKLFLQRWEITDEFLDDQLLKLAKDNKKALDAFVQREAAKLGKIRNVFTKSKKNRESTRDERKVVVVDVKTIDVNNESISNPTPQQQTVFKIWSKTYNNET